MDTHILGFPRIGVHRELKKALEGFWKDKIDQQQLLDVAATLKERHWGIQSRQGLSLLPVGDFSLYDHVLDTSVMLGAVPPRFNWDGGPVSLATFFRMARGDADTPPMEMTKWFDTNYHYIVPEFHKGQEFRLSSNAILDEVRRVKALGHSPKPVLVGPVTYIALGTETDGSNRWDHLDAIVSVYEEVIAALAKECEWIQIDEPLLVTDLDDHARAAYPVAYERLTRASGNAKLLLATYFGSLDDNLELALSLGTDAIHVDLVRGAGQLDDVLSRLDDKTALSVGVVDGRNVWKTDINRVVEQLRPAFEQLGPERLIVGSSCSLLHSPIDLSEENLLASELRDWMAFAVQKCEEVSLIGQALAGDDISEALAANQASIESRQSSSLRVREEVRQRIDSITPDMLDRTSPYPQRAEAQTQWLKLPLFPTTTIGSYPQTPEIRRTRRQFKKGQISKEEYNAFMQAEIKMVVTEQEQLGLDVLVHGEPERNDMVEYFGQQLDGYCFTDNGWVQSYGSRCVKPPIIFGDISRSRPMTVEWMQYAQSLTERPMKGMLTGPVTMLCWSFVRDDLSREEVCRQIALAIRDEVLDLESVGIKIIQIDEAAFREGMPLRRAQAKDYLRWAVESFRLSVNGVEDTTQIHSHMCYSDFNAIVDAIVAMDCDVISIEASRSGMDLLNAFETFEYPNEIGPGVYDIHSPRVPPVEEILDLLRKALAVIPARRLWSNPDCGLKTRAWPETRESLANMVTATLQLREEYEKQ